MSDQLRAPSISADTLKAYLETDYRVAATPVTPDLTLRVGERCEILGRLVMPSQPMQAVFITACNPLGIAVPEAENQAAQSKLASLLAGLASSVHVGEGQGRDAAWPAEPSYLAVGLDFDAACELARQFRQNAIIWVGADLTPNLVVLRGGT